MATRKATNPRPDLPSNPNASPSQPARAAGGEAEPASGLVLPAEDGPNPDAAEVSATSRRLRPLRGEVRVPRPTYIPRIKRLVLPRVNGVEYRVDDKTVAGSMVLSENATVTAVEREGFTFREGSETSWDFEV